MIPPELQIFLLAMTPVGELRVAIPLGLGLYQMAWPQVLLISVLGNLLPVVVLLLWLGPFSQWLMKHSRIFRRFFNWLFERTRKRHRLEIERYGWWGLMVFVAIPLPMTGGWSGTLVAFLTGMPFWRAFSAIALGVVMAGLVVTAVVSAGLALGSYLGWQALVVFLLLIGGLWALRYHFKHRK